jgi:hypothetical protein
MLRVEGLPTHFAFITSDRNWLAKVTKVTLDRSFQTTYWADTAELPKPADFTEIVTATQSPTSSPKKARSHSHVSITTDFRNGTRDSASLPLAPTARSSVGIVVSPQRVAFGVLRRSSLTCHQPHIRDAAHNYQMQLQISQQ